MCLFFGVTLIILKVFRSRSHLFYSHAYSRGKGHTLSMYSLKCDCFCLHFFFGGGQRRSDPLEYMVLTYSVL